MEPTDMAPALSVRHLVVERGGTPAVIDATFEIGRGEIVGLLGPNGAGKTTLLEAAQGYLTPSSGNVEVFGLDPVTHAPALASRWGVMPQTNGLPMGLTVRGALRLFAGLHGSEVDQRELLDLTGLTDVADRRWRRLSGGQQQRLSLAIALCGGRDLLLLDEPTAAVDDEGRRQILELVGSLEASGATVVITTHRFDDVEQVCDRVIVIDRGRIVADDDLASLTADPDNIRFRARPALDVSGLAGQGWPTTEIEPGHYQVAARPEPHNVAAIVAWLADREIAPETVEAGRVSLASRYRALIGQPEEGS